MKKLILFVIIFNILSLSAFADGPKEISAPSVILMEQSSGRVLYEKGADIKRPIASVTKVMTALLLMEKIDAGEIKYTDMITTSENAFSMGGSQVYLEVGELMSVDDMLKALMVASGNDAAVAIGEHVSGSLPAFIELMNKRAKELGCTNSNFVNTNGLPEDNHYSSARDVALISRELLSKHPDITKYTTIWMDSLRGGEFQLANTNKLVVTYKGITGLKTGFTSEAMHCLSASATRDNLNLIAVVLGAPDSQKRFSDAANLLDYGFDNFVFKEGITKEDVIIEVPVKKGKEEVLNLVAATDYAVLDEKKSNVEIEKIITTDEEITAPILKGQKYGMLTFKKGDKVLGEIELVAQNDVEKKGFFDLFAEFFARFLGMK